MTETAHSSPVELAQEAAHTIAKLTGLPRHDIALTLGSGWGETAHHLGEIVAEVPADQVPGFRASAVGGHTGMLTSLRLADGRHVLIIGARTHLYEGHGVRSVVHGVRTAAAAGASIMVLTNGAGGLDPEVGEGEAILISDHINLTAVSPIEGAEFVDLTDLYSSRLRSLARSTDPDLAEGVYIQLPGPHFETPAEVRYLQLIGGDAVGMSTALEAIAARQSGMEVLGLSLITNPAAGIQEAPLNHLEVLEVGRAASERLGIMLARIVTQLH
ncbi:purine-nucleoside phosphorylase [Leucobacter sp. W1153]|uniref:purine-nucleoside phosphorylase n=1 Tax=Leucobacter sp. W1153 TaxID=3439064 RepID=UPI003F3153A2